MKTKNILVVTTSVIHMLSLTTTNSVMTIIPYSNLKSEITVASSRGRRNSLANLTVSKLGVINSTVNSTTRWLPATEIPLLLLLGRPFTYPIFYRAFTLWKHQIPAAPVRN